MTRSVYSAPLSNKRRLRKKAAKREERQQASLIRRVAKMTAMRTKNLIPPLKIVHDSNNISYSL
jgi:hypothetical protein